MLKHLLLVSILASPLAAATAHACVADRLPEGGTSWVMPVHEIFAGADHRADTCDLDTLAAQVANVAERHPGAVVSIAGYAMRTGSPSLALARVSLLVDRLQQSLLQKIGRQRVPLDARVVAEYEAASEPDLLGRIVLRLHTRSTP